MQLLSQWFKSYLPCQRLWFSHSLPMITIVFSHEDPNQLMEIVNTELKKLLSWFLGNKLSINIFQQTCAHGQLSNKLCYVFK